MEPFEKVWKGLSQVGEGLAETGLGTSFLLFCSWVNEKPFWRGVPLLYAWMAIPMHLAEEEFGYESFGSQVVAFPWLYLEIYMCVKLHQRIRKWHIRYPRVPLPLVYVVTFLVAMMVQVEIANRVDLFNLRY